MAAFSEILHCKCAQFRDEGQFIDVRLKVDEDVFPVHRIVLAASSDYFYAMFTNGMKESNQEMIELKDESITSNALKIILDSIYTGDLHVTEKNVFEVLAAAFHLQVTSVVQHCSEFLKKEFVQFRLDLQNYCLLCTVANRHGMKDLREAAESKMALTFKDICESEEFLSVIEPEQLVGLLSRDDLSAPSETFIFQSVMQWIKHKKEERMAVAAKVIGAVRLGLVDIRVVLEELNTEEMQRDPEIHKQVYEALVHNNMPSNLSKFTEERAKPRSTSQALIAVLPKLQMKYFDFQSKIWKNLPSTVPSIQAARCDSAISVGCTLFVTELAPDLGFFFYRYDTKSNAWERKQISSNGFAAVNNLCILGDYIYAISSYLVQAPKRYNIAKRQWQSISKLSTNSYYQACNIGAIVHQSIFVLCGNTSHTGGKYQPAVLHCFDPAKNEWEEKARTCQPHFGSSLFEVNGKLFVAGGKCTSQNHNYPAPVEVYSEETNTWSVVKQEHIPANNLGAVEIEGKVYFIINQFPIDSGIRISPEERYPVPLDEWENLGKIEQCAVLCYFPLKREYTKTE